MIYLRIPYLIKKTTDSSAKPGNETKRTKSSRQYNAKELPHFQKDVKDAFFLISSSIPSHKPWLWNDYMPFFSFLLSIAPSSTLLPSLPSHPILRPHPWAASLLCLDQTESSEPSKHSINHLFTQKSARLKHVNQSSLLKAHCLSLYNPNLQQWWGMMNDWIHETDILV